VIVVQKVLCGAIKHISLVEVKEFCLKHVGTDCKGVGGVKPASNQR
jgi:hypothetical protein